MDARERILKAMDHEEPDKVPSFEISIDNLSICKHFDENYVFSGMVKTFGDTYDLCKGDVESTTKTILMATETRSYMKNTLNSLLSLNKKIGIELALVPFTGYILFPMRCEKTFFIDEYGRIFDLRFNPSDGMDMAYFRDGAFKSFEDYESVPKLNPQHPRREKYFKAMKKVEAGYQGDVYIIPSLWGIFEPVWQAFGFTNFSKLLSRTKEIKKIFDDRGEFALELVKTFIDWGETGTILIFDDYGYKSGLLMSPKLYRKYVFPWLERICNAAHKRGVKIILHTCGDVYPVFDDIVNAGVDAIHPIEPTTANPEYDIFNLHEKYGDIITFIGNVSPQDLSDKDPKYIEEYTLKLIKQLAPGGGYILSSGHSINPAIKLENFLAMHKILKKHGVYPIK